MANICNTLYEIKGPANILYHLWEVLEALDVQNQDVCYSDFASKLGIDYEKEKIPVRGYISFAEYWCGPIHGDVLSLDTCSKWCACNELWQAINAKFDNQLMISYREIEPGCGIYFVHDEGNFFPEECCVMSFGEIFDDACVDVCSLQEAIEIWIEATGIEQGDRTNEEMMHFINNYEFEDDTYYQINMFEFE